MYFLTATHASRPIDPVTTNSLDELLLALTSHGHEHNLGSDGWELYYLRAELIDGATREALIDNGDDEETITAAESLELTPEGLKALAASILDAAPRNITLLTPETLLTGQKQVLRLSERLHGVAGLVTEREEWIRHAYQDEGTSQSVLAAMTGLSRQRIHQIVTAED